MDQIHTIGTQVQNAIEEFELDVAEARKSLTEGRKPFGNGFTRENPVHLLNAMEPLCALAVAYGVPMEALLKARRGEFVSGREYLEGWN
jgi:hypothetical protein